MIMSSPLRDSMLVRGNAFTKESIKQQNIKRTEPILREVTTIYNRLLKNRSAVDNPKLFDRLNKEMKKLTNMNITVIAEKKTHAWAMTPRLRRSNALSMHTGDVPDSIEGEWIIDNDKAILGSKMDTSNVWVTGPLSKQPVKIGINIPSIQRDLNATPAEIVAILLHEMGHAWNGLAVLAQIVIGNSLISATMEQDALGFSTIIYKKYDTDMSSEMKDTLENVKTKDDALNKIKWITTIEVSRLHKLNFFDDANSETMAQVFAARFGYGLENITLAIKYDKVFQQSENIFTNPNIVSTSNYQVALSELGKNITSGNPSDNQVAAMMALTIDIRRTRGFRYRDFRRDQFNTLQQMNNRIRTMALTKSELKQLIADHDEAYSLIKDIPKASETFVDKLHTLFTSTVSSSVAVRDFQSNVEALIENGLYLEAKRLTL